MTLELFMAYQEIDYTSRHHEALPLLLCGHPETAGRPPGTQYPHATHLQLEKRAVELLNWKEDLRLPVNGTTALFATTGMLTSSFSRQRFNKRPLITLNTS